MMDIRRRMAMAEDATVTDVQRYASAVTYARRELQNPEDALKFSLLANEMSNYENRNYLGTLANAYFLNGRVEEAIETQKKGIALLTEDDIDARTRWESRLAEFYKASGNVDMKRQAQIDEIARERDAAEAPDASPRAKNGYAWELLTADPADLQDPEEALRVALAVTEETGSQDVNILGTLALAYYRSGQPEKAVEIQDKVVAMTPENEVWAANANKIKRRIYAGEGTTDFDPTEVLPGTWFTEFGPLQVEVECHREGDYLLWVTQKKLPWIPAGEALARIHVESGVIEYQQSDSGWTNLRWDGGGGLRLMESGDVINWTRDWNVARWRREATP
jgi:tetratricopeptide (TPR) repeat protein